MPAYEDNLLILFFVLLVLALLVAAGIALWKPVLSRAWRYLLIWWERDKIAEAEAQRLKECRQQAEAEVSGDADALCQPVESSTSINYRATSSEPSPTVQKVKR